MWTFELHLNAEVIDEDQLGDPVHPKSYSDIFEWRVKKAKFPVIRLHDARHTCGTLMHLRGVQTAVRYSPSRDGQRARDRKSVV